MKSTSNPAASAAKPAKRSKVFSDAELQAMKDAKTERRKGSGESDLLAKVAELKGLDRELAEKIHAIIKAAAPDLSPKTWYGMPAYADKNGKIVCFFTPASKFKSRYATFGFEEAAKLDEGNMWPTSFALTKLTAADEARIGELVKKAAG